MSSEPEEKSLALHLHIGWSPMTIFSRFVSFIMILFLYRQLGGLQRKDKKKVQFFHQSSQQFTPPEWCCRRSRSPASFCDTTKSQWPIRLTARRSSTRTARLWLRKNRNKILDDKIRNYSIKCLPSIGLNVDGGRINLHSIWMLSLVTFLTNSKNVSSGQNSVQPGRCRISGFRPSSEMFLYKICGRKFSLLKEEKTSFIHGK